MLLSCRILVDVASANRYSSSNQLQFTEGDQLTMYIQLIDASLDRADQGFNPSGRRYVPASGATLSVTFDSNDNAKKVSRSASKPFAGDDSIWSIPIQASDPITGTVNLRLTLTESGVVTRGIVQAAVLVRPQNGF